MTTEEKTFEQARFLKDFYESLEEIPYATYVTVANKAENEPTNPKKIFSGNKIKHFEKYYEYDCMVVTGFRKSICREEDWKNVIEYLLKRLGMTISDDIYEFIKMEKESDNYGLAVKINPVARAARYWQTVINHPGHQGKITQNHYQITLTNWKEWESSNQQAMPRTYAIVRGLAGGLSELTSRLHILSEWVNKNISKNLIVIFGNVTQNLRNESDQPYIDNESVAFVYGSLTKEEEGKFFTASKRTSRRPGTARCGCFMYEFYNTIGQMVYYQFASRRTLTAMAVYEIKRIDERIAVDEVYKRIESKFPNIDWIFPNFEDGELSYFAIFRDAGPQEAVDLSDMKYDDETETPTMVRACFTPGVISLLERRRLRIKMYTETSVKSPWLNRHGEEDPIDGVLPAPPGRIFKSWAGMTGTKSSVGPVAAGAYATVKPPIFNHVASSNGSTETDRSAWDSGGSASSNPSRGVIVPSFNPPKKTESAKGQPSRPVMAPSPNPTRKEDSAMGADTPSNLTLSTKNTRLEAELRAVAERLKRSEAEVEVERYRRVEAEEKIVALQEEFSKQQEERREDKARLLKMEHQLQFLMQAQMGAQQLTMHSPGVAVRGPLVKDDLEEGEEDCSAISESPKKRPALCQEEPDLVASSSPPASYASGAATPSTHDPKGRTKALSRRQRRTASIPFPMVEKNVAAESPIPSTDVANRYSVLTEEQDQDHDTVMDMELTLPAAMEEVAIADSTGANRPAVPLKAAASSLVKISQTMDKEELNAMELDERDTDVFPPLFPADVVTDAILDAMDQPFDPSRERVPFHFNGYDIDGLTMLEFNTQWAEEPMIMDLKINPHRIQVKPSNDLGLDGAGNYTIPLGMCAYATQPIPVGSSIVFESKVITPLEFTELQKRHETGYVMQSGHVLHDASEARKAGDIASAINNSVNVWSTQWNRPAHNHCTLSYSSQKDKFSYKVTRPIRAGEEIYSAYSSSYNMKKHIEDARTLIPTPIKQPFSSDAQTRFIRAAKKIQVKLNDILVSLDFNKEARECMEELMIATYCHDGPRAKKFLEEKTSYILTTTNPRKDPLAECITSNGLCGIDSIFYLHCKQRGLPWPTAWAARKPALGTYMKQVVEVLEFNPFFGKLSTTEQLKAKTLLEKTINALERDETLAKADYLPNWLAMLFADDVQLTLWEPIGAPGHLTLTMQNGPGGTYVNYAQLSEFSKIQHSLKLENSHFEPILSPPLDNFPSVVDGIIRTMFARYVAKAPPEAKAEA